jgi:hypothetical protein
MSFRNTEPSESYARSDGQIAAGIRPGAVRERRSQSGVVDVDLDDVRGLQ